MRIMIRVLSAAVILALLISSGVAVPVAAGGSVTVSINAPADDVTSGENFTATVDISQVENFDAANYDVSFDPTVLEITDPVVPITDPPPDLPDYSDKNMYGQINGTEIPVVLIGLIHEGSGPADPTVIRVVQNVPGLPGIYPPGSSPVTGSGYLAVLHFHVIGSPGQSSEINLSNGTLSNTSAEKILATWVGDSVHVTEIAQIIAASVDFDPDTLNLKSNGKMVTTYIELPKGYDVKRIGISSIRLNGIVPALAKPSEVGDYDKDGVLDLMVKFDRSAVSDVLTTGDLMKVTLSGKVAGIDFEGSDFIRVINR
ncbi:hypothetical protein ES703_29901 [subsurface metagenome]